MGKKKVVTVGIFVTGILATAFALNAQDRGKALFSALGKDQYLSCGLDKLSHEEQNHLFELVSAGPVESHITESAIRYMEQQGWQRIRVIGALETDDIARNALGAEAFDIFLELKRKEIRNHNTYVSAWEIYKYFEV